MIMMMINDDEMKDEFGEGKCNISIIEEDQNYLSRNEVDNMLKPDGTVCSLEQ